MTPLPPLSWEGCFQGSFWEKGVFSWESGIFFYFFSYWFFGGCVWDDGLIFRSGGVEIHWVLIVSPLSQLLSSFNHQHLRSLKSTARAGLRTYLQIFFIILRKLPPRIPLISWSEYPLATRALVRLGSLLASSRPLAIMGTPSKSEPRPM